MLKFDNISIEYNWETLEISKTKDLPIMIDDEDDSDSVVELTIDQAKWIRDNIDYIIKKFDD